MGNAYIEGKQLTGIGYRMNRPLTLSCCSLHDYMGQETDVETCSHLSAQTKSPPRLQVYIGMKDRYRKMKIGIKHVGCYINSNNNTKQNKLI